MGIVVNRTRLNPFPVKSASGEFISIDDAVNRPVKKLEINFTPKQSFNGYDYPWVGGTNKNKFDESGTYEANTYINDNGEKVPSASSNPCNLYDQKINVESGHTYTLSGESSVSAYMRVVFYDVNDVFLSRQVTSKVLNPSITFTADSSIAYCLVNPDATLTKIQFEGGSARTGYVPYANICPITGYTGLNFYTRNENLWNDDYYTKDNILTLETDPDSVFYGFWKGSMNRWESAMGYSYVGAGISDVLRVRAVYGASETTFTFRAYFRNTEGGYGYNGNITNGGDTYKSAERQSVGAVSGICNGYLISTSAGNTNLHGRIKDVMVSWDDLGEYVAPISHDYPITWQTEAGDVYGGILDLLTGVLTANWTLVTFNGTESWVSYSSGNRMYFRHEFGAYGKVAVSGQGLCNLYPWYDITGTNNGVGFRVISSSGFNADLVNIRPDNVNGMTATIFKGMLADWYANGTPCTVAYKMKNPVTYQLDSHQISTLMGSNRLWTDVGTISLDYRAMRHAPLGNGLLGGMLGNPVPTEPEEPEEPAEETEE